MAEKERRTLPRVLEVITRRISVAAWQVSSARGSLVGVCDLGTQSINATSRVRESFGGVL